MTEFSKHFHETNGFKQGCVMTLATVQHVVADTFLDCDTGFPISIRSDGKVVN